MSFCSAVSPCPLARNSITPSRATIQSGKYPSSTYVRFVAAPFTRAADTCDDRTTRVPNSSAGGPSAAARFGRNTNGPLPSAAVTASARRFISAANIPLRITHAVGASTASGSFDSISATSSGWNVLPLAPAVSPCARRSRQ